MKKHYKSIAASLTLLFATTLNVSAQLSGFVTIDSSQPTTGSVYQSFSAFAAAVNTAGVNGPLTVNVTAGSGPYNEQFNLIQTPGISPTNSITFNGNGCTITFSTAVAGTAWTMLLSGADYMTFNNINFINTGTAQARACHLWNGSNDNRFNNCTFSVATNQTGTGLIALAISGTSVSGTATGNSGNNNVISSCTMTGGYYNTYITGSTTAPLNTGNQVLNSVSREFYLYGLYNGYSINSIMRGNIVERPTRAAISTGYGIYLSTGCVNGLFERNHVRNLAGGNVSTTSSMYAIYVSGDGSPNNENLIRNNLVSDMRCNGVLAGIYLTAAAYANAYHNTIVLDDPASTSGTTYGIYCTGPNDKVRNNIVSITRAGTGTKYCIYLSTAATNLICNHNVYYINPNTGNNNTGYLGGAYLTMAQWQAATVFDSGSSPDNPVFTNPSMGNYVPTAVAVNNLCPPIGVTTDFNNTNRSIVFPDPGAFEFYNTSCNSAPGANSFVTPTVALCPGTTQDFVLTSTNTYTNSGYAIQWWESTFSALGPYTASPTGTLNAFTTSPINMSTFFVAVITCTNGQASYTTAPGLVQVAATTTNSVPYYEGFESLALNELPNCSWSATGINGATQTYTTPNTGFRIPRTGTNYASFSNSPSGTNYFYSNGIWMTPGITYSAALWFVHETANVANWPSLSIMVGMSQNPSAMTQVASTNGTLTPSFYTLLSNTFTVALPGYYYVGVRGVSGGGVAPYLTWDDLSVTIPCNLNGPQMAVSASAGTICSNQAASIYAIGAGSYSWSTGQTVSSILVSPGSTTTYSVMGTNTLSGCSITMFQTIHVKPAPVVAAFANDPVSCPGVPVTISAQGAGLYNWSSGDIGPTATVSPMATTIYSVIGTNSIQCSGMGTVEVVVNPAPNVSAGATSTFFCSGQAITFSGTGASTYEWMISANTIMLGNQIVTYPNASGIYTLTGTGANGCEGVSYISFGVEECTGINELNGIGSEMSVYPNPGHDLFTVVLPSSPAVITLYDVNGRVLLSQAATDDTASLGLHALANGVYYLKAVSDDFTGVIKVVKQ